MLYYIHDDNNKLIGFRYNGETYYYKKNIQEDIIGILDSDYNVIVNYQYDAWGRILSITDNNGNEITNTNHIAYINSFRYRSYYYDNETKLYYLNSRYYNSNFGRFSNADNMLLQSNNMIGNNVFVYCLNSPISRIDMIGNYSFKEAWNDWCGGIGIIKDALGKKVEKTKQDISNTINFLTNVTSSAINNVRKIFVAEAGIGVGFGGSFQVGSVKAQISAYKDFDSGINQGEKYDYSTTSASII